MVVLLHGFLLDIVYELLGVNLQKKTKTIRNAMIFDPEGPENVLEALEAIYIYIVFNVC